MSDSKQTIYSIHVLRGIAAVAVLLTHHYGFIQIPKTEPFGILFSCASWGVDLFFIISGFIAAYTIPPGVAGYAPALNYFVQRLIRIVPLYYLLTLSSFGADSEMWWKSIKSMLFIPAGNTSLPASAIGPIYGGARIGQGWTLNYEMFFYFIVALSFMFGKKKWVFTALALGTIIIMPLIAFGVPADYLSHGFQFSLPYLSMMTHPIILEFLLGVLIGVLYPKINARLTLLWWALILATVWVFVVNTYSLNTNVHGIHTRGWYLALLIVALLKLEKCGYAIKNPLLLYVGTISYSIYLLQFNIQNIFIKLFKHASGGVITHPYWLMLLSISTTFIVAHFTHKYIEDRFSQFLKKKWANRTVFVTTPVR
ncbi:acyltransferase [Nissabacter sp. SGAir0207]|uniref:acyltransferase family protein n=1 Tax=Nissabacter sp. SGAir0207 TaxID=2126321 RepID=UPI0010CCD75C|nr:acyltransferase [Nissabacter sp. SGAir0207]QCR36354.1 acyltransferase [Nissabacter sp. SGAir0207]